MKNPIVDAVRTRWGEERGRRGAWRTAKLLAGELWEFVRDSTPERRRARYGDMDYDWEVRVDTTAANVGWRERLAGTLAGTLYQPSDANLFRASVGALEIDYERFTFVDIGSGKGRALLLAAESPFRRVMGVELLAALHGVALENIRRFPDAQKRCGAIEATLGDAREFAFPPEPTVLFLFNPLPEPALARVLENVDQSVMKAPREFWIVYHNPVLEHMLSERPWLRRVRGNMQFAVYTRA